MKLTKEHKKKLSLTAKKRGFGKWMIGKKHSEETKKKMRESHKGKIKSEEHRRNLSIALTGKKKSKEHVKKNSEAQKGKTLSKETRQKISISVSRSLTGKKLSKSHCKNIGLSRIGLPSPMKGRKYPSISGKNNYNWKGGITPKNKLIRRSTEYRTWREDVFKRDGYTCQKYGIKGCFLHPHHIKNFAEYPSLRFNIKNGITLSKKAHQEFHKIYGRKNNTNKQLTEFLKL